MENWIHWEDFGMITFVIASAFAIIGAMILDFVYGRSGLGYFLNYGVCLLGAYLANIVFIYFQWMVDVEPYRALLATTIGMTMSYLTVMAIRR